MVALLLFHTTIAYWHEFVMMTLISLEAPKNTCHVKEENSVKTSSTDSAKWMQQTVMIWMGIKVDRSYTERMLYGPQTNPGMFHRAGYDDRSLRQLIEQSGYMVELSHTPYPIRPTPSMLVIARKL